MDMKIKNSKDVVAGYGDRFLMNEKNDCTVRSLAACLGLPYLRAHEMAKSYGRRARQGMNLRDWYWMMKELEEAGYVRKLKPKETKTYYPSTRKHRRMRLSSFTRRYSSGRYIIDARGHATSVIQGEVVDSGRPRDQYVQGAWEVTAR